MTDLSKEIIKWVLGIVASALLLSIKISIDTNTNESNELKQKVNKIYDYTTNHEVRMMVMEKQVDEQKDKILDLQLSQERWGDFNARKRTNQVFK